MLVLMAPLAGETSVGTTRAGRVVNERTVDQAPVREEAQTRQLCSVSVSRTTDTETFVAPKVKFSRRIRFRMRNIGITMHRKGITMGASWIGLSLVIGSASLDHAQTIAPPTLFSTSKRRNRYLTQTEPLVASSDERNALLLSIIALLGDATPR